MKWLRIHVYAAFYIINMWVIFFFLYTFLYMFVSALEKKEHQGNMFLCVYVRNIYTKNMAAEVTLKNLQILPE